MSLLLPLFFACAQPSRSPDVFRVEGRLVRVDTVDVPSKVQSGKPTRRIEIQLTPERVVIDGSAEPVPAERLADERTSTGDLVLRGDAAAWPAALRVGEDVVVRWRDDATLVDAWER